MFCQRSKSSAIILPILFFDRVPSARSPLLALSSHDPAVVDAEDLDLLGGREPLRQLFGNTRLVENQGLGVDAPNGRPSIEPSTLRAVVVGQYPRVRCLPQ